MSNSNFRSDFFQSFATDPDQLKELLSDLDKRVGVSERDREELRAQIQLQINTATSSGVIGPLFPDELVQLTPTANPDELQVSFTAGRNYVVQIDGEQYRVPEGTLTAIRPSNGYTEFLGYSSFTVTDPDVEQLMFSRQRWETFTVLVNGSPPDPGDFDFDNSTGKLTIHDVTAVPDPGKWEITGDLSGWWTNSITARKPSTGIDAVLDIRPGFTRFPDHSLFDLSVVPITHAQIGAVYDLEKASAVLSTGQLEPTTVQRQGDARIVAAIDGHTHSGEPGDGAPVKQTVEITAGETVGKHQAVAVSSLNEGVRASHDDDTRWNVLGIALADYNAGESMLVQSGGAAINGTWNWTNPYRHIYVGLDGSLTETSPTSGLVHQIAIAQEPDKIYLGRGVRIIL